MNVIHLYQFLPSTPNTWYLVGHDASELSDSASDESEEEDDTFEDDIIFLRSLDPKEAKDQDHYKVLGMSKMRYKATDEQIKKAYR